MRRLTHPAALTKRVLPVAILPIAVLGVACEADDGGGSPAQDAPADESDDNGLY